MIIPEYKIELLNKSKKVINSVENIDKLPDEENLSKNKLKNAKSNIIDLKTVPKKTKKTKNKKKGKVLRTLWVRRKKKIR